MRLAPGYTVLAHLARTERLDTYEVWSEDRACSCVAKALRRDRRGDEEARAGLREEGARLVALSHPHLVRGYELIEAPDPVLIMETLSGETLAHLLDGRPEGLDLDEVAWLGLQLASALAYLHRHDLLHLDVKPANVVAEDGRAKLLDLSIARPPGPAPAGLGTPGSMAPEQEAGGALTAAADVWGLGAVLREAAPASTGPLAGVIAACLRPEPAARPALADIAGALVPHAPGARPWGHVATPARAA